MGWFLPTLPVHRPGTMKKRIHRRPGRRRDRSEISSLPSCGENPPDATRASKSMKEDNISKTMANNYETEPSSKPSVKGWVRRVLRKEDPRSKPGSATFRNRFRITKRKNDPTNMPSSPMNSRTMTDESSSQNCRSHVDESPHRKILQIQMNEAYRSPNSSPHDIYKDQKNQSFESNVRGSDYPLTPICPDTAEEESGGIDESETFTFEKSEIIAKLFPLGYPSSQETSEPEITIDFVAGNDEEGEDKIEDIETPAETSCEEAKENPLSRSEIVSSLFPMGHPDSRKKKETKRKSKRTKSGSTSRKPVDYECDKFINMIITFDPTWDLLEPEQEDGMFFKSKLKKLQEIENYEKSILGNFAGDNSSAESVLDDVNLSFGSELFAFPHDSSWIFERDNPNTSFELGYHFDSKRFPIVETREIEICFFSDDASIEYGDNESAIESSNTPRAAKSPAKFPQQFEFLSDSEDSRNCVHIDDTDSICSLREKIFLNHSLDCIGSESTPPSPVATVSKLHSLSFLSSPLETISPNKLFLFTDRESDHTECESESSTSTQIAPIQLKLQPIDSLCMPKIDFARQASTQ